MGKGKDAIIIKMKEKHIKIKQNVRKGKFLRKNSKQ